jgi:ABC-type uncharacterized transport system permease subunit
MYLVQERQLKSRRPTPSLLRLPPVDQLDVIGFRLLLLGFGMYTAGMVGGFVSSAAIGHWTALKTVWASLVWMLYAVLLIFRGLDFWRGRRFALGGMAVFVFTIVGLWGVTFFK